MVIDHRVHVVVADAAAPDLFAAAVGASAATVGDPADLLDVDVYQGAGPVMFVAHGGGLRSLDKHPGHRIAIAQVGDTAPKTRDTVRVDSPSATAMSSGPQRCRRLEDRSSRPASPSNS